MDLKNMWGEFGGVLGTGFLFKDHPEWAFATIISIVIINKGYNYMMRNHRLISDKYIDKNGNHRETKYK